MAEQTGVGMTPWEFAQHLQEQHFKGKAPDVAEDICDLLLANLLAALSPDQRKLVEDIPVIVLPTRDPNAVCLSCPGGGFVVAMDYGLMSLYNVLNKIVLCRLNIFSFEPLLDLKSSANMARNAVSHFLGMGGEYPRWAVPPKRVLIASALGNVQASFVIGHELSHVLLGHLGNIPPKSTVIYPNIDLEAYTFTEMQDAEARADQLGASMVVDHFAKIYDPLFGPNEPSYSQAGVHMLFSYFELVNLISGADAASPTHPSPSERRELFEAFMWENIPDASKRLARAASDIVASIMEVIRSQ
jgi:hypothetical protein